MNIISKKALQEFWGSYTNSKVSLQSWYSITKKSEWENITEVKTTFPHADLVGKCTVFNIGGNKFRLITKINYKRKIIYVRFVLTHNEYDRDKWKDDCEC